MKTKNIYLIMMTLMALGLASCDDNKSDKETDRSTVSSGEPLPELIPPAPGEVGGLADDRTPLNEGMVNPDTIQGAGLIVEEYAIALRERDFGRAYDYWNMTNDAAMTEKKLTEFFAQYQNINTLIGKPEKGLQADSAIVPVQIYGRMVDTKEPFNLLGNLTLVKNGEWMIVQSNLQQKGTVREESQVRVEADEQSLDAIPESYRGHWAQNKQACTTPGETNIIIYPLIVNYWESEGDISDIKMEDNTLNFMVSFHSQGREWDERRSFSLSENGQVLMDENNFSRVKCPDLP